MTEDPDSFGDDDKASIDDVSIIDKLDILITLIENGPKDRYKALTNTLYEARFQSTSLCGKRVVQCVCYNQMMISS